MLLTLVSRERHQAPPCFGYGGRCLFLVGEVTDVMPFATDEDVADPLPNNPVPRDASMTGCGVRSKRQILGVLPARRFAQIRAAIVERVAIDVVDLDAIARDESEQFAMQVEGHALLTSGDAVVPRLLPA